MWRRAIALRAPVPEPMNFVKATDTRRSFFVLVKKDGSRKSFFIPIIVKLVFYKIVFI